MKTIRLSTIVVSLAACCCVLDGSGMAADPKVINVWPGKAPGETKEIPAEAPVEDGQKHNVANKPIIRLGNVSTPQLAVYKPDPSSDTGRSVIICPGGGHFILAYDLEGTEVAEWLNTIGVTGIVLKYRVPFRDPENRCSAALQDSQRAVSLVRSKASELGIHPDKIGILGFSAGGEVAARTALQTTERTYPKSDAADDASFVPNFAVLIYPAYLINKDATQLQDSLQPKKNGPPMFLVHAFDDPVTPQSSLLLASALKRVDVPFELHVYPSGGHGYGLRHVDGAPVTDWAKACEVWLKSLK